jgi:integrase/recombinase XerD
MDLLFVKGQQTIITVSIFRHNFAIISYLNKVDVFAIMKELGHESINTTMIYFQNVMDRGQHSIHK